MRIRPLPRSTRISVVSPGRSCGVSDERTSSSVANAVTTRLTGAVTCFASRRRVADQRVRIERLSLPTGMPMPSAGASSRPTARTES